MDRERKATKCQAVIYATDHFGIHVTGSYILRLMKIKIKICTKGKHKFVDTGMCNCKKKEKKKKNCEM